MTTAFLIIFAVYSVFSTIMNFETLKGWRRTLDGWNESIQVNDELIEMLMEITHLSDENRLPNEQEIHDYLVKVRGE